MTDAGRYHCILADPPWPEQQRARPQWGRRGYSALPYQTLAVEQISRLPVGDLAAPGCHLWLWTTNRFLHEGFHVLEAWGFRYHAPITWLKTDGGVGNWFVHVTQTLLFAYRPPLRLEEKYNYTGVLGAARTHSRKPEQSYDLIEAVSPSPRLELFARQHRLGWDVWGNEVESNVELVS